MEMVKNQDDEDESKYRSNQDSVSESSLRTPLLKEKSSENQNPNESHDHESSPRTPPSKGQSYADLDAYYKVRLGIVCLPRCIKIAREAKVRA